MSSPGAPLRRLAGADDPAYDELLAGRPAATFFHTRAWAQIVTTAFPQLRDESGVFAIGERRFALPLFRWSRLGGLITTTHSSFPFLYGGPIPATAENWGALLDALVRRGGSWLVQGNPFAPPPTLEAQDRTGATEADETHLLVLPATVDLFWRDILTTQKRNDIRRLTKKGVRVEVSRDPAEITRVYELYRQRMAAWARRPGLVYPIALYQAMLAAEGDVARLYVARYEDHVIGGTFVCRWNGIVHYTAGYFDHQHRRLRPNVLIQERIIRDAIEERQRLYDMLPSAGLPNVAAFKESFGGVATAFPRWRQRGRLHRLLLALRGRLHRS